MKCLLVSALLAAAAPTIDTGSVSSATANYDGNALVLKGEVVLDHGLGTMRAEQAVLQRQEAAGKEFPFAMIHLQNQVALTLKEGGELVCDIADLDFTGLQGALSSTQKVVYTDAWKRKKGASTPFRLSSPKIDLVLGKLENPTSKALYDISEALAHDTVQIDYGEDFHMISDAAAYHKARGQIRAQPKDADHPCQLTHGGDLVLGLSALFDLAAARVDIEKPVGTLRFPQQEEIHFSATVLSWDMGKNLLSLRGNARVEQAPMGTIASEEIIQIQTQGKDELKAIKTQGKTTIVYQNEHKITAYGTLYLDRAKLRATIESPKTSGEQIVYEEGQLTALADQAVVEYSESWEPVSISLKGSVKIFSTDPNLPQRAGIADRVTYLPPTRTFILAANPGKKVLFFNEGENLRIGASEVHITEDAATRQQSVKGIGNVQLTFSAEEQAALEKIFNITGRINMPQNINLNVSPSP